MELERPGVDRRTIGPGDRRFGRDDVEQVDPPRGPLDHVVAARTAGRDVVLDDRPDLDAHDLHERDGSRGDVPRRRA